MTTTDYDPALAALSELAASGCPTPEDLTEDMTPLAMLLFAHDLVYAVMTGWTIHAQALVEEAANLTAEAAERAPGAEGELVALEAADTEPITRALQGLMSAAGALDAACSAMAILPPEAAGS